MMKQVASLAGIASVLVVIFCYTASVRRPNAGTLSYGHHEWLTAHALKFARMWWHEGAFELDFLMMETPKDIEHPTLVSRQIYPSYPPGAVLAAYVIAKTVGEEPSVGLLMKFNLALHLFIAMCLSLAVWLWIPHQPWLLRLLSGIVPGTCYLLLPGPMFWQQNVYFTDTAVMAPYALLLLSCVLERVAPRTLQEAIITIAFIWGFATDWFFVSIALIFVSVRLAGLLARQKMDSAGRGWAWRIGRELGGPALAACLVFGFYGWQLTKHMLWGTWRAKFALRTFGTGDGADSLSSNFNETVWGGYMRDQYSHWGNGLLVAALVFAVLYVFHGIWKLRSNATESEPGGLARITFVAVAVLAPVLHTYVLKNHTFLHDFSVLKFAIPLSCIPFVILPHAVIGAFKRPRLASWLRAATACLGIMYAVLLHPRYQGMVPPREPKIAMMGAFIGHTARYDDVVFSHFVKAEPYPSEPHLLSHTLKLIHQVNDTAQLGKWVEGLPVSANVLWFGDETTDPLPVGGEMLWGAAERVSDGSLFALRLSRTNFLARLRETETPLE